jgi:hypothetical protein
MAGSREGMTPKYTVIWDVTPSSAVEAHRRFGGTHCLHLQGRRVCQVRNQYEADHKLSTGGSMCLRNDCELLLDSVGFVRMKGSVFWDLLLLLLFLLLLVGWD